MEGNSPAAADPGSHTGFSGKQAFWNELHGCFRQRPWDNERPTPLLVSCLYTI